MNRASRLCGVALSGGPCGRRVRVLAWAGVWDPAPAPGAGLRPVGGMLYKAARARWREPFNRTFKGTLP